MTRSILTKASQASLEGRYSWQAICDSTKNKEHRLATLCIFRGVFRNDEPWPVGDFETRSLAFLLLREFLYS